MALDTQTHRLGGRGEAIDHDADTVEQVGHCQTTCVPVCHSNCTLLIELLLQFLVFVVHILAKASSMMFNLARGSLLDVELSALVFRLDMAITGCWVRHACCTCCATPACCKGCLQCLQHAFLLAGQRDQPVAQGRSTRKAKRLIVTATWKVKKVHLPKHHCLSHMYTRRCLVRSVRLGLTVRSVHARCIVSARSDEAHSRSMQRRKVAVVGAGFAGISAARTLLRDSDGLIDVTVLEASSRVGGRASTVQVRTPCICAQPQLL